MSRNEATANGTIILKFTTDLPYGPYGVQKAQTTFEIYVNQTGTLLDVKNAMEKFAMDALAEQAKKGSLTGYEWKVLSFSYKGGKPTLDTPLSNFKDEDQLSFTFHQVLQHGASCQIM